MKKGQKLLSVLMSLVLALGLCPGFAMADDNEGLNATSVPDLFNSSGLLMVQPLELQQDAESGDARKVKQVALGKEFSAAIDEDGVLWVWGRNNMRIGLEEYYGVPCCGTPQRLMTNVKQVAVSEWHAAAVKQDGSLWMWGHNGDGEFGVDYPSSAINPVKIMDDVREVACGEDHTAIIKSDRSLWMCGSNDKGQLGQNPNDVASCASPLKVMDDVEKVSLGAAVSAAIKTDGSLWLWGDNHDGRLGIGRTDLTVQSEPTKVLESVKDVSIYGGGVAVLEDGTLMEWGDYDNEGNLHHTSPEAVMGGVDSVSGGAGIFAAVKTDKTLWMKGHGSYGVLGDTEIEYASEPVKVLTDVISAEYSGTHVAAIKSDGSLWMWGDNDYGQLGNGFEGHIKYTPGCIMENVASAMMGGYRAAALKADDSLWMWGDNYCGVLGDGTETNRLLPVRILDNVSKVVLGSGSTAAIKRDNTLWMWGNLYIESIRNSTVPIKIADEVADYSDGSGSSFILKTDGSLWAVGGNSEGNLGIGFADNNVYLEPQKIMDHVASVETTGEYSAAITLDGDLYMWGKNRYGQLGDGTTDNKMAPVKTLEDVSFVALGYGCAIAIKTDNSLWCWGELYDGEPIDGAVTSKLVPTKILDQVAKVVLGAECTAALKQDGTLWTWGDNLFSSVGRFTDADGSGYPSSLIPAKILDDVKDVSLSSGCSAAIKNDGSMWVWGMSEYGPLVYNSRSIKTPTKFAESIESVNMGSCCYIKEDGSLYTWGERSFGQVGDGVETYSDTPIEIKLHGDSEEPPEDPDPQPSVRDLSEATIEMASSFTYTGSAIKPLLQVVLDGTTLTRDVDYELDYSNNVNAGTATVTVSGIGDYTGSVTKTFTIAKARPTLSFASSSMSRALSGGTFTNALTSKTDGKITFASSNTAVARVDANLGTVTPVSAGVVNITATAAAGQNYLSGAASYQLTVVGSSPTPAPTSGIGLKELTYSFSNSREDFDYPWNYRIPLESYELVFGKVQAKWLYDRMGVWGGNCFGMSSTSQFFNRSSSGVDKKSFNSSASLVSDLSPSNYNSSKGYDLTRFIEAMQVSQLDAGISAAEDATFDKLDNLIAEVEKVKTSGIPVSIGLFGKEGGHEVLGYEVEKVSNTTKQIKIYDCNFPNTERSIRISTNSAGKATGWYYHLNDRYNWGSSYVYSHISYTPYSAIESFWKGRGGKSNLNTLAVNAQTFTVSDSDGNEVAEVRDGKLESASSGVFQHWNKSITADDATADAPTLLYVPSDEILHVESGDTSGSQLEVGVASSQQSSSVSTDSKNVTLAVNDDEDINLVEVDAGAGEAYSVRLESSLASALGQESVELSGMGNGTALSMGMVSGNCVVVNGETASMFVNGDAVDTGSRVNVAGLNATLDQDSFVYDGNAKEPGVTLKHGSKVLQRGTDYVVVYSKNVAPGTARATAYGIGSYGGKVEFEFSITKAADISGAKISVGKAAYSGKPLEPAVSVKLGSTELKKGVDYTLVFSENVNAGQGTVTVVGKGFYTGKATAKFSILPASIAKANVSGVTSKVFTGKPITQSPVVKLGGKTLASGTDYEVSYKDNVAAGNATLVVTGKGNYAGTKATAFTVAKAANPLTVKAKSKVLKAKKSKKTVFKKAKAFKVSGAAGKVTFKKLSGSKKIAVAKGGKVTVKKGLKPKAYKVKVQVTAAGDANHNAATKVVTLKVKVAK